MTAATDSATAAAGGGQPPQDGPHAGQDGPAEGRSATAGRPVPGAPAATVATPAQTGRTLVPAARRASSPVPVPGAWLRTLGATRSHLSQQLIAAAIGDGRDSAGQGAPVPATPVGDGPERAAVAYVDGLDGSERKVLMHHIAQAFPGVVAAGAELVAEWRAECAEHRRKNDRRKDHDRRRRRRSATGGD